ncbi:Inner membrane transport protein YdhC [compost metagenome]
MKTLQENHKGPSTLFAMALIPLSGFATDIYLPSLPAMAEDLNISTAAVQLSLVVFMFSTGLSQFFVGPILDSFGRYRIGLVSLALFALASFGIALIPNIYFIYAMRVLQGITIALIVVGKRAYFVDLYTGDKLKGYISLFSIIWACAPIMAPFLGGYLQNSFGWQSNFYFLGILSSFLLVMEFIYSGETLRHFQPFKAKNIADTYLGIAKTLDFTLGLLIVGVCFGIVITYSLSGPFIIEKILGHSAVVTGYGSLLSGLSIMVGGVISKKLIKKPMVKKIVTAFTLQILLVLSMIVTAPALSNIFTLVGFTIGIHICGGFIFNIVFGYCLSRFTKNAGVASGITGVMYMLSSSFSYGLANFLSIKSQMLLGIANASLIILMILLFFFFNKARLAVLSSHS